MVVWSLLAVASLGLLAPTNTQANGGTLVFNQDSGPFNIQLAISPTPPVPTIPAHFTMVVSKSSSDIPVADATSFVQATMTGMPMPGASGQRFIQNQSRPNQYDVDVPVTMEGNWNFSITIVSPSVGQTTFTAQSQVEKPDAPWPIIIAILVALPALAALTWWFLFRNQKDDDEEDEGNPEVKLGT